MTPTPKTAKDKKTTRPFFSGYGEGYFESQIVVNPPEVHKVNTEIWRMFKCYYAIGVALAFLIPDDVLSVSLLIKTYTAHIVTLVPYIKRAADASYIPQVLTLWYAIMLPLSLVTFARYLILYPYRFLPAMARRLGFFRHLLAVVIFIGLSWLWYGLMISGTMMPDKSYSSGHARLLLALISDYRFGLAFAAPALLLAQVILYLGAVGSVVALFARFFNGGKLS